MKFTNIQLILIVNFMFSVGLLSLLLRFVKLHGGTSYLSGFVQSLVFLISSVYTDFIHFCFKGTKRALHYCLLIEFLCFVIIIFFTNIWILYLCKLCCVTFNQISKLTKEYLIETEPLENHIWYLNVIEICCHVAVSIGSICGAYVFSSDFKMTKIAAMASVITFATVVAFRYGYLIYKKFQFSVGLLALMLRYVKLTGGPYSYISSGFCHSSAFFLHSISRRFLNFFFVGTKHTLHCCLFVEFLCFFTIIFYTDIWILIGCKLCGVLFNQIAPLSREYIISTEPKEKHIWYSNLIEISCHVAVSMGSVCGCYMFSCENEICKMATFASVFTLTTVLVVMGLSNIQLVFLSVFLYFFSVGLLQSSLSHHLTTQGANQIVVGWMTGLICILQSIGPEFVALFEHGKKFALIFCYWCAFLTFITVVLNDTLWVIVGLRLFYALFNQTPACSKAYVAKISPIEKHVKYFNLIESMRVAGLAVGNVLGAYLYFHHQDFSLLSMFSTVFTLIGILLMQYVDEEADIKKTESHLKDLPSICYKRLKTLKTVNYKKHWDSILLQAAYTTTFSIYFVRFCFLIAYNYHIGTVVIGYTISYQHVWLFANSILVPFFKEKIQNKRNLFEHSLLISGFILPGLYYAPTFECYLFLLVPMFFCFSLVNSLLLEDDALGLKSKGDVYEASNTIAYLVNVFGPFFFGIVLHLFGGKGFKVLSLLPMVICVYLLNQRFMKHREEREEEEEQETEERIKQD